MHIRQTITAGIISFIMISSAFAQKNESSKAKIILFDAIKFTEKASIKATNPTSSSVRARGLST